MKTEFTAERPGRLSDLLKREGNLSSGLINRLKWQQKLLVNGTPAHTDYPVQPGDRITVVMDEPAPDYPAEDGALTVLYEDDFLLAVEKPAGTLIHPSRAVNTGTLANRVAGYYRKTGQPCAFHPLTRLDRDTFGVVLLAKSAHIHTLLTGKAEKTYHALVLGAAMPDAGEIRAPIARRPLPSLLREVREDGKPSLTQYRVLARMGDRALLSLTPVTGRTHQLRIHCAWAGFPILGDPQYGDENARELSRKLGLTTQALCAKRIVFPHPVTGQTVTVVSGMDVIGKEERYEYFGDSCPL